MKHLIAFFSQFGVEQGLNDIKELFWADETNEHAQFYMRTYKEDIEMLKDKYQDAEKSFDDHIDDMRRLNNKLASISRGQFSDYSIWVKTRDEPATDVEFRERAKADESETAALAS